MYIQLEGKGGQVVQTTIIDNEWILRLPEADYPLLSRLSDCAYDSFSPSDMPTLIMELTRWHATNKSAELQSTILGVIALAERCRKSVRLLLTFTPFEES